jgi:hypothetical protein
MAERMYRTQILLEPQQHETLHRIARCEGRSVSDLVREIVRKDLSQREEERQATIQRRLEALDRIEEFKQRILARRGGKPLDIDVVEWINQAREEQDARNFSLLFPEGD